MNDRRIKRGTARLKANPHSPQTRAMLADLEIIRKSMEKIKELRAENEILKAENKRLKIELEKKSVAFVSVMASYLASKISDNEGRNTVVKSGQTT